MISCSRVVRLLLYSDMPVMAAGLNSLLQNAAGYELSAVTGSIAELRSAAAALAPAILLLDLTAEFPPGILGELDSALIERNVVLWVYEIPAELALQAMSLG